MSTFAGGHGLSVYAQGASPDHAGGYVIIEQMGTCIAQLDLWQLLKWDRQQMFDYAQELAATADEADTLFSLMIQAQTELS